MLALWDKQYRHKCYLNITSVYEKQLHPLHYYTAAQEKRASYYLTIMKLHETLYPIGPLWGDNKLISSTTINYFTYYLSFCPVLSNNGRIQ